MKDNRHNNYITIQSSVLLGLQPVRIEEEFISITNIICNIYNEQSPDVQILCLYLKYVPDSVSVPPSWWCQVEQQTPWPHKLSDQNVLLDGIDSPLQPCVSGGTYSIGPSHCSERK